MHNELITVSYYVMWNLLVFSVICFLISGFDDLFIDLYYWISTAWRTYKLRNRKKLTYEMLTDIPEKNIAIMIPCWSEAGIIDSMLKFNINAIDYEKYDIFVGVYPNDPETLKSVELAASQMSHIKIVMNIDPGPTNKAKNLNMIYSYIQEYEKINNIQYEIFVLHDSEDIIHSLSLKLYNYLMPKKDMIQIPMYPLVVSLLEFTHWTYNAEFCENHTKDIIVRERIGGLVPSAGVGTSLSLRAIEILKSTNNGVPFGVNTLTEDYSTSLKIHMKNLKQIFVSQYIYKKYWRKRWFFFGKPVAKVEKDYIATRAIFPMSYFKAVRQKSRWIYGISFQEWMNTGWKGNIATLYTLIHDRKAMFSYIVTGISLIVLLYWSVYSIYIFDKPDYSSFQDLLDENRWIWYAICIVSILMLERFLQRFIAVWRIYGLWPSIVCLPLLIYGNVINLHALLRSYKLLFFGDQKKSSGGGGSGPAWDKTDHTFPAKHILQSYQRKLGDILIDEKYVTKEQLQHALEIQSKTGEQLGKLMQTLSFISADQLTEALAKQFALPTIPSDHVVPLAYSKISRLSKHSYHQLIKHDFIPLAIVDEKLVIAIHDPSNEINIKKIFHLTKPYEPTFVLIK